MAKIDYETARARERAKPDREQRPIGPAVRPAMSGKRYDTFGKAANAARWANDHGRQRHLYEWFVQETDAGGFELWRRPRRQPKI